MKKNLLGIILFIAGIVLMGAGLVMQFVMPPATPVTNNPGTETGEQENGERQLQDVSTFDFATVTQAVITGQAAGFLTTCNNDAVVPTPVDIMSLNGVLTSIKKAKGYVVSEQALDSCASSALVIGTLTGTDFTSKLLEVEQLDTTTLLISSGNVVYEFVFEEDVTSILGGLVK